jgi:hypothetical protein
VVGVKKTPAREGGVEDMRADRESAFAKEKNEK